MTDLAEDVSVRVADAYYLAIAGLTDTKQIEKNRSFNTKIVYTGIDACILRYMFLLNYTINW